MKIIKLTAENIKKITAVEIEPSGNLVTISGKNGAGKTSVLDAIWWALGGERNIQGQPIREGADKARVRLDLGEINVERRITKKGTQLIIMDPEGKRYPSPQRLLDALVGKLSFDPLDFTRLRPADQAQMLRDLIGIDTTEHDASRKKLFDERTEVNRRARDLGAQITEIIIPQDEDNVIPDEEISITALTEELNKAIISNKENDAARGKVERLKDGIAEREARILELQEKIEVIRGYIEQDKKNLESARKSIGDDILIEPIQKRIADAEKINAMVRLIRQRSILMNRRTEAERQAEELTKKIESIDAEKARLLAAADFPVAGLGLGDGGITYNDLPLEQASSAEQLRISVAMAMALNPKIRIIRITDGSLLDSDSLGIIRELTERKDFQVWLEAVDESGNVGVYIEDGAVVAVNE